MRVSPRAGPARSLSSQLLRPREPQGGLSEPIANPAKRCEEDRAGSLCRGLSHRLDIVAIGIENERGVIGRRVIRP